MSVTETRRLYAFTILAEELHYGRAAKRLMMSQSPLSRLIIQLENDLGVLLFDRNRRRVELTPSGIVFFDDVTKVLALFEAAAKRAREADRALEGTVS